MLMSIMGDNQSGRFTLTPGIRVQGVILEVQVVGGGSPQNRQGVIGFGVELKRKVQMFRKERNISCEICVLYISKVLELEYLRCLDKEDTRSKDLGSGIRN